MSERVLALVDETRPLKEGTVYVVLDETFDPSELSFIERCTLNAKLVALAEMVYPGTYEEYQKMQAHTILDGKE